MKRVYSPILHTFAVMNRVQLAFISKHWRKQWVRHLSTILCKGFAMLRIAVSYYRVCGCHANSIFLFTSLQKHEYMEYFFLVQFSVQLTCQSFSDLKHNQKTLLKILVGHQVYLPASQQANRQCQKLVQVQSLREDLPRMQRIVRFSNSSLLRIPRAG
jgi:hypothetical protein